MTTVVLLIFAGVCAAFSFWCFNTVIGYDIARAQYNKKLKEQSKKKKQQQYIVVEEDDDESEVDRQNREYGDYYGDSYYL